MLTLRKTLPLLAVLTLMPLTAQAASREQGDSIYEQFAHWGYEQKTDSVLTHKAEALSLLADNHQWEHYYYVASLAIQMRLMLDNNPSACLRECQQLYRFATDHYHAYGRAMVQAQTGWIYGYIGDHQEAVRQLRQSIDTMRRLKKENRDVLAFYYIYAYMLELTGNYDEQQRIIDESKRIARRLNLDKQSPQVCKLLTDQLQNTEALMLIHRGKPRQAAPIIGTIEQKLASGTEHSVYEAYRAIAEYRLATGDCHGALAATADMERQLHGSHNAGLQWGLNLLRSEILRRLGRSDEAYDTLSRMMDRRNTANISQLRRQLSEMDAQYQMDELRIHEQKSHFWWAVIVALIVICGLLVFNIFRYIAGKKLKQAHAKLVEAYEQLEETTTAKERIESELRIARDIQMSMVPNQFPHCEGLDMYAAMTPARAVGGDLYGYLLRDGKLYFAVGDVSGKGVPASLFMAQATRLFQTMASQGMQPADICTRMNQALSGDDNKSGMFVTFFLGLVDLATGHLSFCNAGHNPPLLDSEFMQMETNAPIGIFPDLQYVGEEMTDIRGHRLFVYTDGLNEAENQEQQQFGDDRLQDILRCYPNDTAHQLIDRMTAEVEHHRNGAEANDDLTMLCIRVIPVD